MKIPLIAGRDFLANDTYPGAAIVNEAFAKEYFRGQNPVGKLFERTHLARRRVEIVGLVRDARYSKGIGTAALTRGSGKERGRNSKVRDLMLLMPPTS
jgi:hypothetical protein